MWSRRPRCGPSWNALAPQSDQAFMVQQPAEGDYCVVQAVFQHGRLLAAHCYTARARGVGGSAHARESVWHAEVVDDVARLGTTLAWHGALHMEYFVDQATGRRQYLEANPRIGETMNATWAGVNLCEVLVQVSLDRDIAPLPPSQPGIRTHSLMMSLLGAAERGAGRHGAGGGDDPGLAGRRRLCRQPRRADSSGRGPLKPHSVGGRGRAVARATRASEVDHPGRRGPVFVERGIVDREGMRS